VGGCSVHLFHWSRLLCVEFMFGWCFGDGPFLAHALVRLVDNRRIGSFDWIHGPRDSRCAVVPRIWGSGGNSVTNMSRVLLMGIPSDIMMQRDLWRVVCVQQNSLRL
jgi:hypothetical protein